jgi:hypothetical protein
MNPAEIRRFLIKNQNADLQAENAIEKTADASTPRHIGVGDEGRGPGGQVKLCSHAALVEEVRRLKLDVTRANLRTFGLRDLRREDNRQILNPNWDMIEDAIGADRLSTTRVNLVRNSNFSAFTGAVPDNWTAVGTSTNTQVAVRTGGNSANFSCRIVTAGATGGIYQRVPIQPDRMSTLAFWIFIASGTGNLTVTTDGASPFTQSFAFSESTYGASSWIAVPWPLKTDTMTFIPPADATYLEIKFEGSTNSDFRISDVQLGPGIMRDPELWEVDAQDYASSSGGSQASAVQKTANEDVSGSTTLQNDDALLFAIEASVSVVAVFTIKAGAALGTTGIKVAVTVPSGASIAVTSTITDTGGVARALFANSSGGAMDFTTAMFAANDASITITASVGNGANAGNVQLQWAQSTSSGTQLTVYAGSSGIMVEV